jgi:hypothetical protein
MPASTIVVQHKDGTPVRGVRVRLIFAAGHTDDAYTDHYGQVVIEHSAAGRATVYVSGKEHGSFHAPGKMAVTVR